VKDVKQEHVNSTIQLTYILRMRKEQKITGMTFYARSERDSASAGIEPSGGGAANGRQFACVRSETMRRVVEEDLFSARWLGPFGEFRGMAGFWRHWGSTVFSRNIVVQRTREIGIRMAPGRWPAMSILIVRKLGSMVFDWSWRGPAARVRTGTVSANRSCTRACGRSSGLYAGFGIDCDYRAWRHALFRQGVQHASIHWWGYGISD